MITLYVLGKKGLCVLEGFSLSDARYITKVIIGKDKGVVNDYSDELEQKCIENKIEYTISNSLKTFSTPYALAIGWRQLINYTQDQKLIVFHDSILPRLRGFNPLVTALINGDTEIGVTALFASKEYDKGDIIGCEKSTIQYPIKIEKAINIVANNYTNLANRIVTDIIKGKSLEAKTQNEEEATYSLWRDQEDYSINWDDDAKKIERHVNAVGFPYMGATTMFNKSIITIVDCIALNDVVIENRAIGKVIFKEKNNPIVVCGKGLLKILKAVDADNKPIDFSKKFRFRFK